MDYVHYVSIDLFSFFGVSLPAQAVMELTVVALCTALSSSRLCKDYALPLGKLSMELASHRQLGLALQVAKCGHMLDRCAALCCDSTLGKYGAVLVKEISTLPEKSMLQLKAPV